MSGRARLGFLLLLAGCGSRLDESTTDGLRWLSGELSANGSGLARARFEVLEGETALLVTATAVEPLRTHVRSLSSPDEGLFDAFEDTSGDQSKTNAGYVGAAASLNWPVLDADPAVTAGDWEVSLALVDASDEWVPGDVGLDVLLKQDADLAAGAVNATIVWADGAEGDPDLVAATDAALAIWADLYAQAEIELAWTFESWAGDGLEPPGIGSPEAWEEISGLGGVRTVRVVIASSIAGYDDVYGIAGDIPGPLVQTSRSGVLISSTLAAGPDGAFNAEEVRLFGETMAHEAGHYLGLYHPVEVDFDRWDALEDTADCDTEASCLAALSDNLMFPYPVCTFVSCTPQDRLTVQQRAVPNRHVAVE